MTRRLLVAAAACLLLIVPTPAYAIFGGGWLERLSGPGPFTGLFIGARVVCIAGAPDANRPDQGVTSLQDEKSLGARLTLPRDSDARVWLTGAGCHFLAPDRPRAEIGVDFGFLSSNENVLDYSHRPGLTDEAKEVRLRTFLVTADIRVNRILDVGAAIGRASFKPARDDLFADFSRTVTQPMRFTVRPLAPFWNSRRAEALSVRFDATKFHGGFTAEDFGGAPGTYNEPGEIVWAWSFRVNPLALLWSDSR